jgi:hypothetical protein
MVFSILRGFPTVCRQVAQVVLPPSHISFLTFCATSLRRRFRLHLISHISHLTSHISYLISHFSYLTFPASQFHLLQKHDNRSEPNCVTIDVRRVLQLCSLLCAIMTFQRTCDRRLRSGLSGSSRNCTWFLLPVSANYKPVECGQTTKNTL